MIKKIQIYILAILLIYAFYCALIIGSSWDEIYEITIGKDRLKYILSLGSYSAFDFHIFTEYYPGFYNTLAVLITKFLPVRFETEVWHLTNLFFSILTVFGIYNITKNLFNKNVGKIVFLLCFIYPIFFGHMAMNSKDTIFAFANVWSTYLFLRYMKNQGIKKNLNRYIFLSGLTIGLGTGIRLPFLVTLIPIFIYAMLDIYWLKKLIDSKFSPKIFFIDLIKILILAYFVSIAFWPQAHNNIFVEPFRLFFEHIKHGGGGVPWILFNGDYFSTTELPKSYILLNLFFKSPEFILFCYFIFFFSLFINKNFYIDKFPFFINKIILIFLILSFPLIYFIFLPFKVYDGLRLFLFIIPYFCIIPGLTIFFLIENFKHLYVKLLSFFIFISFFYFLINFISLTPYQYTYLNIYNGKFANAHIKFENDYWGISLKELIKKIPANKNLFSIDEKIKISFCGVNHEIAINELNKIKDFNYEVKDFYEGDFDYVIMTNRAQLYKKSDTSSNIKTCFQILEGKDIISVKRNGLILSTLRKKL